MGLVLALYLLLKGFSLGIVLVKIAVSCDLLPGFGILDQKFINGLEFTRFSVYRPVYRYIGVEFDNSPAGGKIDLYLGGYHPAPRLCST